MPRRRNDAIEMNQMEKKIRNEEQITICLRFMWNVSSSVFLKLFLLMESIQFDTAFLEEEGNFDQFESQTQCGHRFERKILTCNLQFIDL